MNCGAAKLIAFVILAIVSSAFQAVAFSSQPSPGDPPVIRVLDRFTLYNDDATEVALREHNYAPGWTVPTHYHHSDLFIYVMDGAFEVTMEETGKVVYTAGQALRMKPETVMDARNANNDHPLKLVVFQVGKLDEPFVAPVE